MNRILPLAAVLLLGASPAFAHVGHADSGPGAAASFLAGAAHPFSGLDHIAVMLAVGLWAALKGGRALWLWPVTFVAVMLVGGIAGMSGLTVPFVEPAILASVVALGLLVSLAIDLPLLAGAAIVGLFAFFHGHAHGTEAVGGINGFEYLFGFAISTAALHGIGIGFALAVQHASLRPAIRLAGVACMLIGAGLMGGLL